MPWDMCTAGIISNITSHKMFWGHVRKHSSKSKKNLFTNRHYGDLCLPVSKILLDLTFSRFLIPLKPRLHCWDKRNATQLCGPIHDQTPRRATYITLWRQHGLRYAHCVEKDQFIGAFRGSSCPGYVCLIKKLHMYS